MNKHISLELAKQIAEVAKEKGVELPESEKAWYKWRNSQCQRKEIEVIESISPHEGDYDNYDFIVPAYDCQELGEILKPYVLEITVANRGWEVVYLIGWVDGIREIKTEYDKSEVEARGKMLLYLLENDLMK